MTIVTVFNYYIIMTVFYRPDSLPRSLPASVPLPLCCSPQSSTRLSLGSMGG